MGGGMAASGVFWWGLCELGWLEWLGGRMRLGVDWVGWGGLWHRKVL